MTQQGPPIGTIGEEAVKLLRALHEWTREGAGEGQPRQDDVGRILHDLNEHLATGAQDCRYCPVCRLIGAVRATSPDVRQHLGVAASSLLQAAAGFIATAPVADREGHSVEHIDVDGDWEDEI